MSEPNPYAPPTTDVAAPAYRAHATGHVPADLREAITALNAHLSDPAKVEEDRAAYSKWKVHPAFAGLALLAGVGGGAFAFLARDSAEAGFAVGVGVGVAGGLLAFVLGIIFLVERSIGKRSVPAPPDATLKAYLTALSRRHGYAWACLCPTAREQPVTAPEIAPVPIGPGEFVLQTPKELTAWAKSFALPGNGQMRTLKVKRVTVVSERGEVAEVEVHAVFEAWPQWANIVSAVLFVVVRLVGLIAYLALYFSLRKRFEARFTKTLIRGKDGLWYVYSAALFEGDGVAAKV